MIVSPPSRSGYCTEDADEDVRAPSKTCALTAKRSLNGNPVATAPGTDSLPLRSFQCFPIPLRQIRSCFVSTLTETHQRILRRWGSAHGVVRQQEFFHLF